MKEKRDCKECGKPLKDWQVKQGYDLCLECYNSGRRKTPEKTKDESKKEECILEDDLGEHDERLEG